jgi:hypothetical protein
VNRLVIGQIEASVARAASSVILQRLRVIGCLPRLRR